MWDDIPPIFDDACAQRGYPGLPLIEFLVPCRTAVGADRGVSGIRSACTLAGKISLVFLPEKLKDRKLFCRRSLDLRIRRD